MPQVLPTTLIVEYLPRVFIFAAATPQLKLVHYTKPTVSQDKQQSVARYPVRRCHHTLKKTFGRQVSRNSDSDPKAVDADEALKQRAELRYEIVRAEGATIWLTRPSVLRSKYAQWLLGITAAIDHIHLACCRSWSSIHNLVFLTILHHPTTYQPKPARVSETAKPIIFALRMRTVRIRHYLPPGQRTHGR